MAAAAAAEVGCRVGMGTGIGNENDDDLGETGKIVVVVAVAAWVMVSK